MAQHYTVAQRNTAPVAQHNTAPMAQHYTVAQRNTAPVAERNTAPMAERDAACHAYPACNGYACACTDRNPSALGCRSAFEHLDTLARRGR
jgi:hypothetical protein